MYKGMATMENSTVVSQKLITAIWSNNPTSVFNIQRNWNQDWQDIYPFIFTVALFTIAKMGKQPKYPSMWMDKENVVHIYNGILFSL